MEWILPHSGKLTLWSQLENILARYELDLDDIAAEKKEYSYVVRINHF